MTGELAVLFGIIAVLIMSLQYRVRRLEKKLEEAELEAIRKRFTRT